MDSDPRLKAAHERLKEIRKETKLSLKPTPLLKTTFTGFDGEEHPFNLRYYQVQGVLHLVAMNRFLLGDDTGIGKCVTGDTMVLTDQGLWPIRLLRQAGWGKAPEAGTFEPAVPLKVWTGRKWARIKSWYYDGVRPTIRLRSASGFEVEGSHRHPVLVRSADGEGFEKLPDIHEALRDCPECGAELGGHVISRHGIWTCETCGVAWCQNPVEQQKELYICIERRESLEWPVEDPEIDQVERQHGSRANPYNVPDRFSPELGRLLGYYVAEGHSANKYGFTITQHHKESHDDIRGLLHDLFGWEGDHGAANRDQEITVSSIVLRAFLDDCGAENGKSATKEVPCGILQSTCETVRQFLRGLFEGDGCVDRNAIEYASKSKVLVQQVQTLLLRFGVVGSRFKKVVNGETYWRLFIQGEDARQFARAIGFVTERKNESLRDHDDKYNNPNRDVVPFVGEPVGRLWSKLVEATRVGGDNGQRHGSGVKQFGSSLRNTIGFVKRGERNLSYQKLGELLSVCADFGLTEDPDFQALHEIRINQYFYDRVEMAMPTEKGQPLMDIEVEDEDHSFVGNGLVNHNTIQSIASLCFVWAKDPNVKAVILTNKSVVGQWALEFEKFCTPGEINVLTCIGSPPKREKIYKDFEAATGPTVLIMGYATSRRDIKFLQHWKDFILVCDEATAFKNPSTQTYKVVRHLSRNASRFWALTATLIKNNLIEGYAIYSLLIPGLFPSSKNKFMTEYCLTRLQPIPGSRRQIPVIIGYRKDQIKQFKDKIDPYFLARAKFDVATELPVLTIKQHKCGMTRAQEAKYREALEGLLEKDISDEEVETTKLTALIYCQQIVDHPELVDCEGDSDKMNELFTLLTEGDLEDEKVIVFTRFRKMVDKLEEVASSKKYKMKTVRVTGSEDEEERKAAMQRFQDPNSDVRVCWITEAAKEGINLQAAKALIFYDSPWSAGDYLQILGRMIRIGSTHDRCYAIHLVATGTIDTKVMGVLRTKMKLIEAVMGKRLKGEGMDDVVVSADNSIDDIFSSLQADARKYA